jgi:preprotein translocase subunit SecE
VATKGKATKKTQSSASSVVRVRAKDDTPSKAKPAKREKKPTTKVATSEKKKVKNPLIAIGGYFKGAWQELRQVRWPNRQAAWSMTAALLAFTAFFVALILLLDALFKYVFQLILG